MNEKLEFKTPLSSIKRIITQDNSADFVIIVNFQNKSKRRDQIQYETSLNKARIISNNINQLCQIDPTINEYIITVPPKYESSSKMNDSKQIEKMLHLLIQSINDTIQISKEEQHFFTILRFLLGEDEEGQFQFQIKNEEEALSFLSTEFHQKSIEYLSLHFLEFIETGDFTSIDTEIMKDIIDSFFSNFRIEEEKLKNEMKKKEDEEEEDDSNEEQTFSKELKEKEEKEKKKLITIFHTMLNEEEEPNVIIHFLLNLKSEEFSEEMIEYFYDELDDEIIKDELPRIICILRNHITDLFDIKNIQLKNNQNKCKNKIECNFEGNELNGIISYLKRTSNKSIHETGDLKLSGGGTISSSCPLLNLTKYDYDHLNDYYFNSCKRAPNEGENWIEFDFGDRKINISSYTIRTGLNFADQDAHPKTWKIVGSNDRIQWKVINKQVNNENLNGKYKQCRFECRNRNNFYRYIRYIQEDSWFSKIEFKYKIKLTCIEFFGSILKPNILL